MSASSTCTADDFARLDDDGRLDLIRGTVFRSPFHGWKAGVISSTICLRLADHIKSQEIGAVCTVASGFILERIPDTVLTPDISCVMAIKMTQLEDTDGFPECAPDLAVEIVSDDEGFSFLTDKVQAYLEAGTGLVWLVEPRRERVTVYAQDHSYDMLTVEDELDGGEVLPEYRFPVASIFEEGDR